jgi:hypothetical protein
MKATLRATLLSLLITPSLQGTSAPGDDQLP